MLGFIFSFLGVLFVNSLWFKISVGVFIFNHLLGGFDHVFIKKGVL